MIPAQRSVIIRTWRWEGEEGCLAAIDITSLPRAAAATAAARPGRPDRPPRLHGRTGPARGARSLSPGYWRRWRRPAAKMPPAVRWRGRPGHDRPWARG